MLAANEIAETLCILAGANAGNAARHFEMHSHELGDIASATLWSRVAQTVEGMSSRVSAQADEPVVPPMPRRMIRILEAAAFQGVRFEDVDAAVLAREELRETSEPTVTASAGQNDTNARFYHAEFGAAPEQQGLPARLHKLQLVPSQSDNDGSSSPPIWSRPRPLPIAA